MKFLKVKPLKFNEDDISNMIAAFQSGKSTKELGEMFNCSKTTIGKILREHGVDVSKGKARRKLDDDKVISMYKEMHNIEEIASYFDVSTYSVGQCLDEHNVPRRSRWDYPQK